jgi:hypothetical protein
VSKAQTKLPPAMPKVLDTPEFLKAWILWTEDRKQRRKPITDHAAELQLETLAGIAKSFGVAGAVASITQSIERGYTGLFPPPTTAPTLLHRTPDTQPKNYLCSRCLGYKRACNEETGEMETCPACNGTGVE